jgi:hypothetical protein
MNHKRLEFFEFRLVVDLLEILFYYASDFE